MKYIINDIVVLKNSSIKFKITEILDSNQVKADVIDSKIKDNWTLNVEDIEPYISGHNKLLDKGYIVTVDQTIFKTYQSSDLREAIFINKKYKTINTNFHYNLEMSKILAQVLAEL